MVYCCLMGGGLLIKDEEAPGGSALSVRGHLAQKPTATVHLTDVENVSPNSFKKMYTDHKNVTQRKCLLIHVPGLGIRCFNPHKGTMALIQNNPINNPFNTNDSALSEMI